MFYWGECVHILYTDDSVLEGPDEEKIRQIVADIKVAGLDTN